MVYILHPKKWQNSKLLNSKVNVMYKLQSQMPSETEIKEAEIQPAMEELQKNTTVEELQGDQLTGSGFRASGGTMKSQPKNEKLRKFVSLKIR